MNREQAYGTRYTTFLQRLADAGYVVLATPFEIAFDYTGLREQPPATCRRSVPRKVDGDVCHQTRSASI